MPRLGSAAKECTETSTPGAHQEGAEQAQREGEDRQQQRPALEQAALVGDRQRMDERGADQPRHERGVLHRIPEPEAAPAELVVGPPASERDAAGEEGPGDRRPRARPARPHLIESALEHRRAGEGERHREPDVAGVEDRRMNRRAPGPAGSDSDHGRPAPAGSRRAKGFEVASVKSRKPKLTTPSTPSTRAAKRGGRRAEASATATRPQRQQQDPQQQRAFVRAPHGGDPVEQRQRRVGILRDVTHREVVANEGGRSGNRRRVATMTN